MPLITRRSSTRATPRTLSGSNGRSRSNCSSLNQNSLKPTLLLPQSLNHIRAAKGIRFMGPDPRGFASDHAKRGSVEIGDAICPCGRGRCFCPKGLSLRSRAWVWTPCPIQCPLSRFHLCLSPAALILIRHLLELGRDRLKLLDQAGKVIAVAVLALMALETGDPLDETLGFERR